MVWAGLGKKRDPTSKIREQKDLEAWVKW
jgi:hypothetical protein